MNIPAHAIRPGLTFRGRGRSNRSSLRRVVAIGPEHRPDRVEANEEPVGVLFVFPESGLQGRVTLSSFCRWAQDALV